MADLLHVLPSLITSKHAHLLPALERHCVTTTDLLTMDPVEIAKRTWLPALDVRALATAVLAALKTEVWPSPSASGVDVAPSEAGAWTASSRISTLDARLDAALAGGFPTGYVTEITGERYLRPRPAYERDERDQPLTMVGRRHSGAGKTQLLLTLLLAVQLPAPHGLARPALYISTEAPLSTVRLAELLRRHPRLAAHAPSATGRPSLDAVLSITVPDLESQDHILRYQLPVSVRRHGVGLVVIDSVAANYRAEFDGRAGGSAGMARRSAELVRLGALLRELARAENVAVVVANQVADRFPPDRSRQPPFATQRASTARSRSHSSSHVTPITPDVLSLDHQQRWFTGWEEAPAAASQPPNPKTPSLGHTWTLQLAARIALLKEGVDEGGGRGRRETEGEGEGERGWRRKMKVVFAPWAPSDAAAVEFVVSREGIQGIDTRAQGDAVP
ncbi:MAG: hypothetical protein M1826_003979 [Phylliscum demangeonii]|nr:MAG: hypothetical protein M1826_003979 [Phylliscum demangeonii]